METSEIAFPVIFVIIIVAIFVCVGIDFSHDTEHKYWISDSEHEDIDEGIEMLVNSEVDSLIVTHPENPNVVGYIYFKGELNQ